MRSRRLVVGVVREFPDSVRYAWIDHAMVDTCVPLRRQAQNGSCS